MLLKKDRRHIKKGFVMSWIEILILSTAIPKRYLKLLIKFYLLDNASLLQREWLLTLKNKPAFTINRKNCTWWSIRKSLSTRCICFLKWELDPQYLIQVNTSHQFYTSDINSIKFNHHTSHFSKIKSLNHIMDALVHFL